MGGDSAWPTLERMRAYSLDDVHATRKRKDSWWTVFLVDPVACRLTLLVANHTSITPNGLTRFSLILGMCSAICFASGRLAAGALLFYVSFMVDCMDGKIARLNGTGTAFGLWLDYVGDRIRVVCCAAGLASGQYVATGDVSYILLGAGVAVLDLFRYVNAPQMKRVREVVKENRLGRLAPVESVDSVVTVGHPRLGEAPMAAGHVGHTGHVGHAGHTGHTGHPGHPGNAAGRAGHVRPVEAYHAAPRADAGRRVRGPGQRTRTRAATGTTGTAGATGTTGTTGAAATGPGTGRAVRGAGEAGARSCPAGSPACWPATGCGPT